MASLSNKCFRQVEGIFTKFRQGTLSLPNKRSGILASSFTFLEGKEEAKRLKLLTAVAEGATTLAEMRKQQKCNREKRQLEQGIVDLRKPSVKIQRVRPLFVRFQVHKSWRFPSACTGSHRVGRGKIQTNVLDNTVTNLFTEISRVKIPIFGILNFC